MAAADERAGDGRLDRPLDGRPADGLVGMPRRGAAPAWLSGIHPAVWIIAVFLLFVPAFTNDFVQFQIFGWSFLLGMIALSLMFLGGYGGMVSLVQMTVAAVAGYMVAIFGTSALDAISLFWPWWAYTPVALAIAVAFGTASGALAVRTTGIYTIMITLAIAAAFYYFTLQNYALFAGFQGFNAVRAPVILGIDFRAATPFYYLSLVLAAISYFSVLYISRAPFGLALQGIRDNARRMEAIGFNVTAHRIAAYAFAALIAAVAGILLVWQNGQISPGTAGIGPVIDILVIAVIGGLSHPIGAFIGALIYTVMRTFAIDVLLNVGLDPARFNLLVGLVFLGIVFFSPDGVIGLWRRWRARATGRAEPVRTDGGGHH